MQQYRRGYNDAGLTLTDEDDLPMWSTKTLTTVKPLNFFDTGGGPDQNTSLVQPNVIDQNKDYDVRRIELNVMTTNKAAFVTADLTKIALLCRDYFLTVKLNESKFSWWSPISALIRFPMQVAAVGASAYDPYFVAGGGANINPRPDGRGTLILKGGQAFQVQLSSTVVASDLSGLDLNITLWGKRYALTTAQ